MQELLLRCHVRVSLKDYVSIALTTAVWKPRYIPLCFLFLSFLRYSSYFFGWQYFRYSLWNFYRSLSFFRISSRFFCLYFLQYCALFAAFAGAILFLMSQHWKQNKFYNASFGIRMFVHAVGWVLHISSTIDHQSRICVAGCLGSANMSEIYRYVLREIKVCWTKF